MPLLEVVREGLSDPIAANTRILPPTVSQDDYDLAKHWHKDQQTTGSQARMLSARIAETAIVKYFTASGKTVEDVSITQLASPTTDAWKRFDLRVGNTEVDVKNARRCERDPRRYVTHCVPRFKYDRKSKEVLIAGALSDYLGENTYVDASTTTVLFLGLTSRSRISSLKHAFADGPLDLALTPSSRDLPFLLPPWLFGYPDWEYQARDASLKVIRSMPIIHIESEVVNIKAVALAAGSDDTLATEAEPDPFDFSKVLLERIRANRLSLPIAYLSVLEHFLKSVLQHRVPGNTVNYYATRLFPAFDTTRPLFLYDPLETIRTLIRTLSTLSTEGICSLREMTVFQLVDMNYLRAKKDATDKLWTTVIAHCGGTVPSGANRRKACGAAPLVLGRHELCSCGKLICQRCGFCSDGCPAGKQRTEHARKKMR